MGNEESRPRPEERQPPPYKPFRPPPPQTQPRNQFSEAQVAELLERQKQHFDKKVEEIIKNHQIPSPTRITQNVGSSNTSPSSFAGNAATKSNPLSLNTSQNAATNSSVYGSASLHTYSAGKPTTKSNPFSPSSSFTSQPGAASSSTFQAAPVKSYQTANTPIAGRIAPDLSKASPVLISSENMERSRAPYNYSQSQLSHASGQTLYTGLNTLHTQNSAGASTSDYVFVTKDGNAGKQVPAPSAPPAPRDRSSSRTRARKEDDKELQVKCPTCKRMYGLTIFQCSSGHSSCNECKNARRVCGLCYKPIGDMRNIMLEELVSEMKVKCPNTEDGCHLFIKMVDMENHAKECPFREMSCPLTSISGCLWKGKLSKVADHFDSFHPMNRQGAVDTEMSHMNLQNNCHVAHLVVLGAFHFIFHLIVSKTQEKVYMVVQLIGTNISASKWTYDIHVYHKGQPRRKYQYSDVCTPVNTNVGEIMSESKCAVLPLSYASTFLCDNKLTYKFYIKKEMLEKPFGNRGRGRGRGGHRK